MAVPVGVGGVSEIQLEVVLTHLEHRPHSTVEGLFFKLVEEIGELSRALNTGRGSVEDEAGDVGIVLLSLLGVHLGLDFEEVVRRRLNYILDPANGHRFIKGT